jgi:hypothetical protein
VRTRVAGLLAVLGTLLGATYPEYSSCKQKIDLIGSGHIRAGSRVELSARELTAYAVAVAPPGVRAPQLQFGAPGLVTGTAKVDFGKVRRAQGYQTGWLMSRILDGERPVSVTARVRSDAGRATVDVQRVEISGISVDGHTLDFLIRNFLLPLYPNATVGRPFELGHGIRKLDVQPRGLSVYIQ